MIWDVPPKIWVPAKPAIIRPADVRQKGMFPFATPLFGSGAAASSTWNPSDKNATAVLSGGNLILNSNGFRVVGGARGVVSHNSGKFYFTLKATNVAGAPPAWGIATSGASLITQFGSDASGFALQVNISGGTVYAIVNNSVSTNTAIAAVDNDIINVAYDAGTGKIWLGVNGAYFDSSAGTTGNPTAGTNPTFTTTAGTTLFPAATADDTGNNITLNTVATPPSGFSSWG